VAGQGSRFRSHPAAVTVTLRELTQLLVTLVRYAEWSTSKREPWPSTQTSSQRQEILDRGKEVVAQVVTKNRRQSQRTSPSSSAVFVRGLTGRNVAVYVDGVRLHDQRSTRRRRDVLQSHRAIKPRDSRKSCAGPIVHNMARTLTEALLISFLCSPVSRQRRRVSRQHQHLLLIGNQRLRRQPTIDLRTKRYGLLLNATGVVLTVCVREPGSTRTRQ